MAITVAQFQSELDSIKTAIQGGDFATAWSYYAQAEVTNAGLEKKVGDHGRTIERRDALSAIKSALEKAEAAASRFGDTKRFGRLRTGFNT